MNVLAVKDLFVNDDEDKVVLVTEDFAGASSFGFTSTSPRWR
jgi:hypothetical protein